MRYCSLVVSCGWLPTPRNGKKNGTSYLQENTLSFSCDEGFTLYGSTRRTCREDGAWTGEQPYCITGGFWYWPFVSSNILIFKNVNSNESWVSCVVKNIIDWMNVFWFCLPSFSSLCEVPYLGFLLILFPCETVCCYCSRKDATQINSPHVVRSVWSSCILQGEKLRGDYYKNPLLIQSLWKSKDGHGPRGAVHAAPISCRAVNFWTCFSLAWLCVCKKLEPPGSR